MRSRRYALALTRTTRSGARSLLVDSVDCAVAVRVLDGVGVEEGGAEAASRSRRAMEWCTRVAEVVAKLFLACPFLRSSIRRMRSRRIKLASTRTTRSGARGLLVDSVACSVAIRVVGGDEVEEDGAEAAAQSRRAMERCRREAGDVAKLFLDMRIPWSGAHERPRT